MQVLLNCIRFRRKNKLLSLAEKEVHSVPAKDKQALLRSGNITGKILDIKGAK